MVQVRRTAWFPSARAAAKRSSVFQPTGYGVVFLNSSRGNHCCPLCLRRRGFSAPPCPAVCDAAGGILHHWRAGTGEPLGSHARTRPQVLQGGWGPTSACNLMQLLGMGGVRSLQRTHTGRSPSGGRNPEKIQGPDVTSTGSRLGGPGAGGCNPMPSLQMGHPFRCRHGHQDLPRPTAAALTTGRSRSWPMNCKTGLQACN